MKKTIQFTVTGPEHARIASAACDAGLSVAAWCRRKVGEQGEGKYGPCPHCGYQGEDYAQNHRRHKQPCPLWRLGN